jgi:nicotinate-nucleotide--dimethylbenzimidazole phosphoribosyltransferase
VPVGTPQLNTCHITAFVTELDLVTIALRVERPDDTVRLEARQRLDQLVRPVGGLGRIGDLAVWLAGVQGVSPPRPLRDVHLVVLASDHGVATADVSAWPAGSSVRLAERIVTGGAPVDVAATVADVIVHLVDVGLDREPREPAQHPHRVRRASGNIAVEDALTRDETEAAVRSGIAIADELIDTGTDLILLANVGVGSTTAAAAVIGLLTRTDASGVIGRASGIDDAVWMRKCAAIRDAMRRTRPLLGDLVGLLGCGGGADLAVGAGLLLQSAARKTPVVLDGVVSAASAIAVQRIAFRSVDWWLAGHRSGDPAQELALDRLSLVPVLDLGIGVGEGVGATTVVPLLRMAARLLAESEPLGADGPGAGSELVDEPEPADESGPTG